jgi:hypothetical protein
VEVCAIPTKDKVDKASVSKVSVLFICKVL